MAYEYYLNVVDHNYPSSEENDSSDDSDMEGLDKFDEQGNPIDKKAMKKQKKKEAKKKQEEECK